MTSYQICIRSGRKDIEKQGMESIHSLPGKALRNPGIGGSGIEYIL
ncbi:hypothetical protein ASZ90_019155 [hydrocarbon metagenome]|uniref:Uncharacterized protein n=1 Tax=hydrocarbon metagenome TaxID=938273 RepID=A0A0W8E4U6_9ZZZZ